MAGLSGASGRRCGILCVRRTRQPVSDPSPLTDTHTPWPRLLMPGAWLCVSWPGHRSLYRMCMSLGQGESPAK